MSNRPKLYSKKYNEYMERVVHIVELKLPIRIYGFTGYNFAYYWKLEDGTECQSLNYAPIEIFEKLIGEKL